MTGMTAEQEPATEPPQVERAERFLGKASGLLARIVVELPDRLPALFLWGALAVAVAVIPGIFHPYVVIPLAVVLWGLTWRLVPAALPVNPRTAASALVALQVIGGWLWMNRHLYSQQLSVYRDPAIFALRAWWLQDHASPDVPVSAAAKAAAAAVSGAQVQTGGFALNGSSLQAQSNSLVPGIAATAGWTGHPTAVLAANLVVGALALLAVYALARRVVGPVWGLAPLFALAASMPMAAFSRSPYTEPTALLLTVGGITSLYCGWRSGRVSLFIVGGVSIGASSLARIDGGVATLGGIAAIGLVAIVAADPARRALARRNLLAFGIPATAGIYVGYLDLHLNSALYLHSLMPQLRPLMVGAPVVLVLAFVVSMLRPLAAGRAWVSRHSARIAAIAAGLAGLGVIAMLTRPLWLVRHMAPTPQIAARQAAEHLAIDSTRTYDENTLTWLSWYYGWPVVVLAGVATALMVHHVIRRRDASLAAFSIVVAAPALLYLNKSSIFPDQIWAMRRYLPVVVPGMLIVATWLLRMIACRLPSVRWLAFGAVSLVALVPLATWGPMFTLIQGNGQLNEVRALCPWIEHGRVVVVGRPPLTGSHLPTTRIVCDAQTVEIPTGPTTAEDLREISQAWGGDVKVVAFDAKSVPWTASAQVSPVFTGVYNVWEESLLHRPSKGQAGAVINLYVGDIEADGAVRPVG